MNSKNVQVYVQKLKKYESFSKVPFIPQMVKNK